MEAFSYLVHHMMPSEFSAEEEAELFSALAAGELSARERVALESARAAFLRSLDAGFVHGPLGPSVKKPRGLAPDDPWLESLQGSSWVDEDLDKRDRSWLDLGSANQAPLSPGSRPFAKCSMTTAA